MFNLLFCACLFIRQLRVTIDWIFSESMLIYYIQTFQESMWPNGVLAEPSLPKTEEEKMKSRIEAKEKLLQNLPGNTYIKI